jgi:hydrogenase expression/formation protein HypE
LSETHDRILLGHGGGGLLSRELIDAEIVPRFGDGPLRGLPDAARLESAGTALVFSTDSFVVQPLEFAGGDIGCLAVHGTVNDIAVAGGMPRWLSLGLILEEGLELAVLRRILDSLARAALDCGVTVATGDTKVVGAGQCDGMYINTAGIGEAIPGFALGREGLRAGDALIASGTLGDHGMAVMASRAGFDAGALRSDTAPVHRLVRAVGELAPAVRFMRDPTRGGLAAVGSELVEGLGVGLVLDEGSLPFSSEARAVAELLGIDLLHVASEGRLLLACDAEAAGPILDRWHALPEGRGAARIGTAGGPAGRVVLETALRTRRLVDVPRGELLPRIC